MKILVIDDNVDNLVSLAAMLRAFLPGCDTSTAISGPAGIELCRVFRPDTILLDIQMPGMDGFQTCQALKSDPATSHIPIIFLTALKGDGASRIRGLELGGDAFLTKPVEPGELLAQVRAMVRIKQAEDGLRSERDSLERIVAQRTAALQTESANLNAIFNCSPMAMFVVDASVRILRVNTAAGALCQRDPSELVHHTPGHALGCSQCGEDSRGCGFSSSCPTCPLRENLKLVSTTGNTLRGVEFSLSLTQPDGVRTIWLRLGAQPLEINGERQVILALDDITAKRQAEDTLRETSERLETLFEASPLPLVLLARDGVVRMWNPAAERAFGWTAAETLDQPVPFVPEADRDVFDGLCQRVLAGETLQGQEVPGCRRKSSAPADFLFSAAPLHDAQDQITGLLTLWLDITEKRQLETQFLRSQRLSGIGKLAGGIAHDLNNILAPVMMAIPLVREAPNGPDTKSLLDTMEASVKRGASIIRQLLVFSRGGGGQKAPVSLGRLVKEMAKIMAETFPKDLTFRSQEAPDLWLVHGDATQLHQVLLNLCVNARDAMPDGGSLTISLRNVALDEPMTRGYLDAKPGPHVALSVADTGTGIAPEVLEHIFEPFFTTKPEERGTGLGLATVLGIVKGHGGFIQVESQVGQGTQFTIYLPALPDSVTVAGPAEVRSLPQGRGQLVLIIDDEESVCLVTRRTLEKNGYRTLTARDGAQGVAFYTQHAGEIQAVVTDLMMPVMNGLAVIRLLRGLNPDLRIIASSGEESKVNAASLAELGNIPFLKKPCTADAILTTLHELFQDPACPPTGALASGGGL